MTTSNPTMTNTDSVMTNTDSAMTNTDSVIGLYIYRTEKTNLDRGDEFAVEVEVNVGEVGGRPSVDHHLVQHQLVRGRLHTTPLLLLLVMRAGM